MDPWGIYDGYFDVGGRWHPTAASTAARLRRAMGGDDDAPPQLPAIRFIRHGQSAPIEAPAALILEDGSGLRVEGNLPPDLPLGYHDLYPHTSDPPVRLVVAPARCHHPAGLRAWGWSTQVYALRSHRTWGHGDVGALQQLADLAQRQGADYLLLSPLHAPGPGIPQTVSPYSPSSRRWRNPLLIDMDSVPGLGGMTAPDTRWLETLGAAGRALSSSRLIDRDRTWDLKRSALYTAWRHRCGRHNPDFDAWRAQQGEPLVRFATHEALTEHFRTRWPDLPAEFRHPDSPAVARFASANRIEVDFHCWLQWLLDNQMRSVASRIGLLNDLAVGVAPDGADAWLWQDLQLNGLRIGAPPDDFNPSGQDWGLASFNPWALRAARYQPFIDVLRGTLRHAAGLRIDHVMGLFRLFLIDSEGEGAYVGFPSSELLDLIALESERAGAIVIGEDLGTVEPGVRDELAARQILSTRLVWFEDVPPSRFPTNCVAALTTHDLPTLAGLLDGTDAVDRAAAGVKADAAVDLAMQRRANAAVDEGVRILGSGAAPTTALGRAAAAHLSLAKCQSVLTLACLEDALGVGHRPNLPGTTDEHPNWRQVMPVATEDLGGHEGIAASAAAFACRGARSGT